MSLAPGAMLGPYRIVAPLGAGGMGEVYRALDPRLGREVAVKVLPPDVAHDAMRLERFTREARAAAALNHPNILSVYDVAAEGGVHYLVSELLEGQTLAERLQPGAGALAVRKAIDLAQQIAQGLAAAHARGIVHRDLKPANVFVTADGRAKILDFGLAKQATAPEGGATTTMGVSPDTDPGQVLGTVGYMAPEQVRGQAVDARADLFAFGAVLYEMLAGRRAFHGESAADTISAILGKDPPDLGSSAHHLIPPALQRIVARCLEKDPAARFQSPADLAFALQALTIESGSGAAAASGVPSDPLKGTHRKVTPLLPMLAATLVGIALGLAGATLLKESGPLDGDAAHVVRSTVGVAPATALAGASSNDKLYGRPSRHAIALSPDSRRIAFSAISGDVVRLYLRGLDQLEARPIAGTDGGDSPFWSPDGRWLGFWAHGEIRKVAVDDGSPPLTVLRLPGGRTGFAGEPMVYGADWGADGRIIFATAESSASASTSVWAVSETGGEPIRLWTLDPRVALAYRQPRWLPDGRVLVTRARTLFRWDDAQVVIHDLASGGETVVVENATDGRFVSPDVLLFGRQGTLLAVRFDPARNRVEGAPIALASDVMSAVNNVSTSVGDTGAVQVSTSVTGVVAYSEGGVFPTLRGDLEWVDRKGRSNPVPSPAGGRPTALRVSPDGRRIATGIAGPPTAVWVGEADGRAWTRLPLDGEAARPSWNSAGDQLALDFRAGFIGSPSLYLIPLATREPRRLTTATHFAHYAGPWIDDRRLVYTEARPDTSGDLWIVDTTQPTMSRSVINTRANERQPAASPDGRWLAYTSDEAGRDQVYVTAVDGSAPPQPVSGPDGDSPAWSRDGRELYFVHSEPSAPSNGSLLAVSVTAGQTLTFGPATTVVEGVPRGGAYSRQYDVGPDGRFLVNRRPAQVAPSTNQIVLVQGGIAEIRARLQAQDAAPAR